jgi:hypothetical protein
MLLVGEKLTVQLLSLLVPALTYKGLCEVMAHGQSFGMTVAQDVLRVDK